MGQLDERRREPSALRRVVVLGGIHGNERTGVHAVQHVRNQPEQFQCGSVEVVEGFYGNPRAIQRNVRYLDRDLNRCFFYEYGAPLTETQIQARVAGTREYEMGRALSLRSDIGALSEPVPFLIDLHTTTANMGMSLIVGDEDPWTLHFCSRLAERVPNARIVSDGPSAGFPGTTASLARRQLTLEVGPLAQGTLDVRALEQMISAIQAAVQVVDELNREPEIATSMNGLEVALYRWLPFSLDYPRDADSVPSVSLHPDFNGSDFRLLTLETPIFQGFDGKELRLQDAAGVPHELLQFLAEGGRACPMFVGESAYVEKGLAFLTAEPVLVR